MEHAHANALLSPCFSLRSLPLASVALDRHSLRCATPGVYTMTCSLIPRRPRWARGSAARACVAVLVLPSAPPWRRPRYYYPMVVRCASAGRRAGDSGSFCKAWELVVVDGACPYPPTHHTTPPSRQPSRAVAPARRGPPHALEGRASSGAPCPVHRRAARHRATSACRRQKAKREAPSMRTWHPPRGPSCHPPLEQGARRPSQSSRPAGHACAVRCPRRWQRSRANHLAGASAHLCRRERGTKARRLPQGRRPTSQAAILTACTRCWRRTRTRASVP